MIQRIQTVYLILAAMVGGGLVFVISALVDGEGNEVVQMSDSAYFGPFVASALLAIVAIFLFRNRKLQFVMNRLNILLNLILLGVFVYRSLTLSGGVDPEKGIGMFLPVVSIVFLALANRAIMRDEKLVKSADRFR